MQVLRTTRAAPPTFQRRPLFSPPSQERVPAWARSRRGGGERRARQHGPLEDRELQVLIGQAQKPLGGPQGFCPDRGLSAGFAPSPPGRPLCAQILARVGAALA